MAGCLRLLAGDDVDAELIVALGGPPARWALTGGSGGPDYWLRVWALRGLMWAWDSTARDAVVEALGDESWRVREMAVKALDHNRVVDVSEAVAALRDDPVKRVRIAAERAQMHEQS